MKTETGTKPSPRPAPLLTEWLAVGAGISLMVIALVMTGAIRRLDNVLYDVVITARPLSPPGDIIIVAIDEASMARIGTWPWPRRVHAEAIDRIAAARPRALGYDVLFTEPAGDDALLDAALKRAPGVVLPMQFRVPGADGRAHDDVPPVVGVGSTEVGHSSIRPDEDGVVRSLDLALDGTVRWPHVAALLGGMPPIPPFISRPATEPLRREGERLIGFRGGPGRFRTVPFAAVLAGEVPAEVLAGRIVIVGATAAGLGDQFSTPSKGSTGVMSGVEIQASFVADLIEGRNLRRGGPVAAIALALVALWLGMAGLLRLRPAAAAVFGAALAALVVLVSAAVFNFSGLWIGPAAALTGVLLAQPLWAWRRLAVVNRWMIRELDALGQAGGLVRAVPRSLATDPVTRTTRLLEATIDRVDELRELADAAIRGLPDATLLVDRDGRIASANTAAEAFLGPAPTLAAVDAAFQGLPGFGTEALADAQSQWRGEHRAVDGSVRDIRFTPWRDAQGAALGWIVRFADISALRRAEAAREEALQLLTHDMRAPQASILALVDRETGLSPALAARLRHLAGRTIALADGYLQLARADAGDYAMTEVDLAAIVTEAVDEYWPQSQAKGLWLVGEGLDDEALVMGNHQLLLRAAVNLIGNAVKFAPAGSAIDCRVVADGADWRFDVVDRGPGVSPEVQTRLFGRFRSGGQIGGGIGSGVGLGLAFVRSVADGHGGNVACVSVAGEGAVFSLRVPRLG
nr:CHASE2 domain-containing protein [Polymorphobacter sp.]